MNIGNLFPHVDIKRLTVDSTYRDTIAASATVYSSSVDMQNAEGIAAICMFGDSADTADVTITMQVSEDDSTWADVTHDSQNVAFNASDNKMWGMDVYKANVRYVRFKFVVSADDAVEVDSLMAVIYHNSKIPVTKDTSGAGQFASTPLELQYPANGL